MQDIKQKSILQMWLSYHRKWGWRWLQAVRPNVRENTLGAVAGIIGAIVGWRSGYIVHGKVLSAIVNGAAGYGVIFFCYSVFAALFMSSQIDYEQENAINVLRTDVTTKTDEHIAAKHEALDALKENVETRKELVKALDELAQARKTISDSSDAFHAEFAKNSALRQELQRFKPNRLKEEWEKLEKTFHDVCGPSNIDIEAQWSKKAGTGELLWWDLGGGWDENSRTRFKFVMTDAGNMLHESSYIQSNFAECLAESDIGMRWILAVCKIVNDAMTPTGSSFVPGEGSSITGAIKDLPNKCILACAFLASQEKWPMPKTEEA